MFFDYKSKEYTELIVQIEVFFNYFPKLLKQDA